MSFFRASRLSAVVVAVSTATFALTTTGCSSCGGQQATGSSSAQALGSAGASASAATDDPRPWVGIPRTVEEVEKVVNPKGEKPYDGKTGTLRGRVTITGDAPPASGTTTPGECADAGSMYDKAFRVGPDHAAADVLVAVTGYEGFVPASKPWVDVKVGGCAFDKRTYAASFGPRFEVQNLDKDKTSYLPYLDPAPYKAVMIALPGGAPVKVYAYEPAINYVFRDYQDRPYMTANVFVLKFATHDVTGLDGKYEIKGIPVGKVKVNALLPATGKATGKEIAIAEGDNTLDLELTYDAKTDQIVAAPADPWQRGASSAERASGFGAPPQPPKSAVPR
jgi:hypothetical protein